MSWAYENVAWRDVPDNEKLAIATMQAEVRDSFLTDAEWRVANAIREWAENEVK